MAKYGRYGQRLVETHEKSMGAYTLHAWRDAQDIASLLQDEVDEAGLSLMDAYEAYERVPASDVGAYEATNRNVLTDFIQKTATQRAAFIRRLKSHTANERIMFLVVACVGAMRAMKVIEIRDKYRTSLAPGRGYRTTVADAYAFGCEIGELYHDLSWPHELIEHALGFSPEDELDDDFDSEP